MTTVKCPCGQTLAVPPNTSQFRCPRCKQVLQSPRPAPAPPVKPPEDDLPWAEAGEPEPKPFRWEWLVVRVLGVSLGLVVVGSCIFWINPALKAYREVRANIREQQAEADAKREQAAAKALQEKEERKARQEREKEERRERAEELYQEGAQCARNGDFGGALVKLNKATETDNRCAQAYALRGFINIKFASNPQSPDVLRWHRAILDLRRASELDPENYKTKYEEANEGFERIKALMGL